MGILLPHKQLGKVTTRWISAGGASEHGRRPSGTWLEQAWAECRTHAKLRHRQNDLLSEHVTHVSIWSDGRFSCDSTPIEEEEAIGLSGFGVAQAKMWTWRLGSLSSSDSCQDCREEIDH